MTQPEENLKTKQKTRSPAQALGGFGLTIMAHGNIIGELIGGGGGALLSIHSGSQITTPTTNVPNGGSTVALLGVALVGLRSLRGKSRV